MVGGTFLCSTCSASFKTNSIRREHMREPWHVFNMQRKVAELPPISLQSYESLVGSPDLEGSIDRSNEAPYRESDNGQLHIRSLESSAYRDEMGPEYSSDDEEFLSEPERCFFCTAKSTTVEKCLMHMQKYHGFLIPNLEQLQTDLETFLAYLNLVIARFHSCVYCGHEKHSADAVRSHMLSKGHCMLDLSGNSDFSDFWADGDATWGFEKDGGLESGQRLSDGEIRLQSGAVASSRHNGRPSTKPAKPRKSHFESRALVTTSAPNPPASESSNAPSSSSRNKSSTLAKRDQIGMIGLSDSQQRSLAITHKKLVAREQRFRNDSRWTIEKFGNTTKMKHFKVSRSGIHSAIQVC